jgi:uncharacterized membrane protein YeaQ/YmgE (transglycosylase-associated protein family)
VRRLEITPALVVVVVGLVALVVLGVVAMALATTGDMGTIATAAFGVIGSIVGAFFGVQVGATERKRIEQERQLEATKGQMIATMVDPNKADHALEIMEKYSPSPVTPGEDHSQEPEDSDA